MRFEAGPVLAFLATLSGSEMRTDYPAGIIDRPAAVAPAPSLPPYAATTGTIVLPGPFVAEILDVVDGDTIEARVTIWLGQQVTTRVRLRGIDTPELSSECAEERRLARAAREALREILAPGRALLVNVGHDKYGRRVLAGLRTGESSDVAGLMLARGLARAYAGGRRTGWCASVSARQ